MKNKKTKLFKPKEMSSPYSTSGIGYDIEHAVQASFLVLMLANGLFTPLSRKRIVKLELQNRFRKAQTDDLTVYTGDSLSNIYNKMFAQIKRNVKIQQKNKDFRETIESAWLDFNNDQIFNEETDKLALITTPLSDTDSCCIKILLDFASEAVIKRTGRCVKRKLTPRHLPNSIGAAGEDYGAKWIVSQEQKEKIRKFWEQVPQALKDAIKQSH